MGARSARKTPATRANEISALLQEGILFPWPPCAGGVLGGPIRLDSQARGFISDPPATGTWPPVQGSGVICERNHPGCERCRGEKRDGGRQLLRGQLSALFDVDRRRGGARSQASARHAPANRRSPGDVPPHPVLPEALSFLLFPRLYGQERQRDCRLPR